MASLHPSLNSNKKQPGVVDFALLDAPVEKNRNAEFEEAFLKNLRVRFEADCIYTYIGDVIVSINPFKPMNGLYTPDAARLYHGRYYYEVPPHLYAMTDDAWRNMLQNNRDQCIIISGESGAGKTEASKHILQYIAGISSATKEVERVKEVLLKSNPILEAFGNAKTTRNNNSSRFGKYMDLQFDFKGDPCGGNIRNYLLEKSRIVQQAKGERSFHIMYQLLESKLDYVKLKSGAQNYAFLKASECYTVSNMNDSKEFQTTQAALKSVGFSQTEIQNLFKTVAGILHLGNVTFEADSKNTDSSVVKAKDAMALAAEMFGTSLDVLEKSLLKKTVQAMKETVVTNQTAEQASYTRDALAKAIYFRMFDWIVETINKKIQHDASQGQSSVIGVLDIYGFEVFDNRNGFEQFCINYCNEKLQQLFIQLTLREEQEEYDREGIQWTMIDYFDNAPILELIENTKNGIICTLDEECIRPGNPDDKSFLEKMNQRYAKREKGHLYYESKEFMKNDKALTLTHFRLKHYAGDVTYDVKGFLDKNMDSLSRDLKAAMMNSKNGLLSGLFKDTDVSGVSKRTTTTGTSFKNSLNELVTTLKSKVPHYVRCIKSNAAQNPSSFEMELCRTQIRYLGLLETVRVRKAGFVFRQPYEKFVHRYSLTCPSIWPVKTKDTKSVAQKILTTHKIPADAYRMGKTKVFIRKPNTLFQLEEERDKHLPRYVAMIQAAWKGMKVRREYRKMKAALRIMRIYRRSKFQRFNRDMQTAFKNVAKAPDLGKSIVWPKPKSVSLMKGQEYLKKIWKRWRAYKMIKALTPEQQFAVKRKIIAFDLFRKKKMYNISRKYVGEYLPATQYGKNYDKFKAKLFANGDKIIHFSDVVNKCSRKGKGQERLLVVTNNAIYVLHEDYSSPKGLRPLQDLMGVTVSGKKDQLLVMKMQTGGDIILDLGLSTKCDMKEERLSECVVALSEAYRAMAKKKLPVTIANGALEAQTLAKKYELVAEKGKGSEKGGAAFRASRMRLVAYYDDV